MDNYRSEENSDKAEQFENTIADGLSAIGQLAGRFIERDIEEPLNWTLQELSGGYLPEIHLVHPALEPDPRDFRELYAPGHLAGLNAIPIINLSRFRQPRQYDIDRFKGESPILPSPFPSNGGRPYFYGPTVQPSGVVECHRSNWTQFFRPAVPGLENGLTRYAQPRAWQDILCLFRPVY